MFDKLLDYPHLREKTIDRSYPLEVLGETLYINPHRLTRGNIKLHRVWIFDLPSGPVNEGGTCHNCSTCKNDCYSRHQEKQYPYVLPFRLVNLYLLTQTPHVLNELIEKQFVNSRDPYSTIRIHSSGDFYSTDEISFWHEIIKSHPEIKFYAYTKEEDIFDFSEIKSLSNFNLINSMIEYQGKLYRNFGDMDYITKVALETGAFICPATLKETKKSTKCNENCFYCITGDKPLFLIHGKGRNAIKKARKIA